jgi:hypothetical protein
VTPRCSCAPDHVCPWCLPWICLVHTRELSELVGAARSRPLKLGPLRDYSREFSILMQLMGEYDARNPRNSFRVGPDLRARWRACTDCLAFEVMHT